MQITQKFKKQILEVEFMIRTQEGSLLNESSEQSRLRWKFAREYTRELERHDEVNMKYDECITRMRERAREEA